MKSKKKSSNMCFPKIFTGVAYESTDTIPTELRPCESGGFGLALLFGGVV